MANLQKLQEFAAAHNFGLTSPLKHQQVKRLAEYWFPEMRFYEDEKFHPIALDEAFSMVEDLFGGLPPTAQDEWRVTKFVRTGTNTGVFRTFDPPVVHVPDGAVQTGPHTFRSAVRVLNDGSPARDALSLPEVGSDTVVTHGASVGRSNQFFGSLTTINGGAASAPGDPFQPRAVDEDENPRITVMAALLNLLDLLKYELTVANDDDYPPDGLRGAGDIGGSVLVRDSNQTQPLTGEEFRKFLLDLIASHEGGGQQPTPPPGWRVDRVAWDAVTRFAFLEYYFFYAYNDWERYQTALFDNEHEGDNEGCCLVFDRNALNVAATSSDPESLLQVVPHSMITSVHEEFQNADLLRFIPTPVPDPNNPDRRARDVVPFTVYVAGGSHATYLTPGNHDLVDFGDTFGFVEEKVPILLALFPLVLAIAIILAIIEHFVDTEDFTSDDGVRTGPESVVGPHPTAVGSRLITLPMSANNHIYRPENTALLRVRAYAGKWGGQDGPIDKSPAFAVKTGRFFRKLLDKL